MQECYNCGVDDLPDGLSQCPKCGSANISNNSNKTNLLQKVIRPIKKHPIIFGIIIFFLIGFLSSPQFYSKIKIVPFVESLMIVALVFGTYFLPMIIALIRKHKQTNPIVIVNIFLGWTLIGWVVALAWSVSA